MSQSNWDSLTSGRIMGFQGNAPSTDPWWGGSVRRSRKISDRLTRRDAETFQTLEPTYEG